MTETTAFTLSGFAEATVTQLAKENGVTLAEALTLVLDQAAKLVDQGTLLGDADAKELLAELGSERVVKTVRVVRTEDLGEALDAVNEVRNAWDETPEAEDGGFASHEHEETSYALDELEQVEEGVSDGHDLSWELTFPNGDELHLFLTV